MTLRELLIITVSILLATPFLAFTWWFLFVPPFGLPFGVRLMFSLFSLFFFVIWQILLG